MITMVKAYRKKVGSKTGGIKLHTELKQDFINANIKIGRDKFYSFLRHNSLLVPKRKNYITTTNSNHMYKKYKNLVKYHVLTRTEQLWVSDITMSMTEHTTLTKTPLQKALTELLSMNMD